MGEDLDFDTAWSRFMTEQQQLPEDPGNLVSEIESGVTDSQQDDSIHLLNSQESSAFTRFLDTLMLEPTSPKASARKLEEEIHRLGNAAHSVEEAPRNDQEQQITSHDRNPPAHGEPAESIVHRRSMDAQHIEAQHIDAQHIDARHMNAQHMNAQHMDVPHMDVPHMDAQHMDAQHMDVQHTGKVDMTPSHSSPSSYAVVDQPAQADKSRAEVRQASNQTIHYQSSWDHNSSWPQRPYYGNYPPNYGGAYPYSQPSSYQGSSYGAATTYDSIGAPAQQVYSPYSPHDPHSAPTSEPKSEPSSTDRRKYRAEHAYDENIKREAGHSHRSSSDNSGRTNGRAENRGSFGTYAAYDEFQGYDSNAPRSAPYSNSNFAAYHYRNPHNVPMAVHSYRGATTSPGVNGSPVNGSSSNNANNDSYPGSRSHESPENGDPYSGSNHYGHIYANTFLGSPTYPNGHATYNQHPGDSQIPYGRGPYNADFDQGFALGYKRGIGQAYGANPQDPYGGALHANAQGGPRGRPHTDGSDGSGHARTLSAASSGDNGGDNSSDDPMNARRYYSQNRKLNNNSSRLSHLASEKRRRQAIKELFEKMNQLVPGADTGKDSLPKSMCLNHVYNHILKLSNLNESMRATLAHHGVNTESIPRVLLDKPKSNLSPADELKN